MPAIAPAQLQHHWVTLPTPARQKSPSFWSFCCGDENDVAPRKVIRPQLASRTFEQELILGLQYFPPIQTKSGVNGSFFLCNSKGQRAAVFKPMNMEAGGRKNHRLEPDKNVQFRDTILPGQGAGNEMLAFALNRDAFHHRYGIPYTCLIQLAHPAFEGVELGSAQAFIAQTKPLCDMSPKERAMIPQQEWEKLNFRLISGSTDAHLGNMLYCYTTKQLYLIDSGDDFVGEDGQYEYYNPWAGETRCTQPMSLQESNFLENLDIASIMNVFERQALLNEQMHRHLKVSVDKYLTQITRLLLAKAVGRFKLNQYEWARLMNRYKGPDNLIHRSAIEVIYDEFVRPHSKDSTYWREATKNVNWAAVSERFHQTCLNVLGVRRNSAIL
jgi:hypothetical protein